MDGQPPATVGGLGSSTHSVNAWSRNSNLSIQWSAATDVGCAGIEGLAWTFDQNPNSIPVSTNQSGDPRTLSFPGLGSSSNPYWFAIRAVDRLGNISATTARLGGCLLYTSPSLDHHPRERAMRW